MVKLPAKRVKVNPESQDVSQPSISSWVDEIVSVTPEKVIEVLFTWNTLQEESSSNTSREKKLSFVPLWKTKRGGKPLLQKEGVWEELGEEDNESKI